MGMANSLGGFDALGADSNFIDAGTYKTGQTVQRNIQFLQQLNNYEAFREITNLFMRKEGQEISRGDFRLIESRKKKALETGDALLFDLLCLIEKETLVSVISYLIRPWSEQEAEESSNVTMDNLFVARHAISYFEDYLNRNITAETDRNSEQSLSKMSNFIVETISSAVIAIFGFGLIIVSIAINSDFVTYMGLAGLALGLIHGYDTIKRRKC
jgi:hypothetical protein